ncbi:folylpolyglutamate synthase protein [Rutstroemia sp. NJR-2017a BVV2]|nr:folylpolyglutamate synthase protein [Rutstroemia sp. NJR-2017a BVV2]PQE19686.1 folylpolyglutamate synthase protein [Rutstroemia sp. NJR-2017a BVV2]
MATPPARSYADALALLDKLQSNRMIVSAISDAKRDMNLDAIPEMLDWTRKAGYEVDEFAKRGLRCLHVAGTKGKGSVCAMVDNILRQYRDSDSDVVVRESAKKGIGKIGLYTSPHLMTVRERIRIDGAPISETLFARYFFELWDRFTLAASTTTTPHVDPASYETKPGYFRYLTIMALHTFIEEGVESAIIECGIGGEYDSTNILPPEAVTVSAITKLGIDHVGMLGDTVDKIAWHKAGIMKTGVPAFTVAQVPEAQALLEKRAAEKGVELRVISRYAGFDDGSIELGAEGEFQRDNASLATAVASSHLRSLGVENIPPPSEISSSIPDEFRLALKTIKWPGRCEVIVDNNIDWLIDGAHTPDSILQTRLWWNSKLQQAREQGRLPTKTILIFNQQDRDPRPLLQILLRHEVMTVAHASQPLFPTLDMGLFTFAGFCTNTPFREDVKGTGEELLKQQKIAKEMYAQLDKNQLAMEYGSVEEAVELVRRVAVDEERVFVLCTGSLHLVGGLMKVLEREKMRKGLGGGEKGE